jgi:hypothetical protein
MVSPFDDLAPVRITDRPIYCPQVNAALSPGNWVLFSSDDEAFHSITSDMLTDQKSIGLIMATSDDGDTVEVNLFYHVTQQLKQDLRLNSFPNPRYKWIPQILRTATTKWIDTADITNVAWVFQQHILDKYPHQGHQGMSNIFLLHYNCEGQYTHIHGCHPFCSNYAMFSVFAVDCYQERVWNGLQVLRAEIARHLGRYSEKQGSFTKVSSQVVVGKEAWQFLLSKVRAVIRPPFRA